MPEQSTGVPNAAAVPAPRCRPPWMQLDTARSPHCPQPFNSFVAFGALQSRQRRLCQ